MRLTKKSMASELSGVEEKSELSELAADPAINKDFINPKTPVLHRPSSSQASFPLHTWTDLPTSSNEPQQDNESPRPKTAGALDKSRTHASGVGQIPGYYGRFLTVPESSGLPGQAI